MMNFNKMCPVHKIAGKLLLLGGLNWGLVGLLEMDVIAFLPGTLARIVYVFIGLSAVAMLMKHKCKKCSSCKSCEPGDEKKEEAPKVDTSSTDAPSDNSQA